MENYVHGCRGQRTGMEKLLTGGLRWWRWQEQALGKLSPTGTPGQEQGAQERTVIAVIREESRTRRRTASEETSSIRADVVSVRIGGRWQGTQTWARRGRGWI